jgi:hypothetical protein
VDHSSKIISINTLQYKLDFSGLSGRGSAAGNSRDDEGNSGMQGDSKGTTSSTEGSM